jgi:hypothetical protein
MPQRDQHNAPSISSQAGALAQQEWEALVKELPDELEAQARTLGAFQRARALPNAQALLRAILYYVLAAGSLRWLSAWSALCQVSSHMLSATAWNKRLRQAAPWLLWLLTSLLQVRVDVSKQLSSARILLVDATHVSQRGPNGQSLRLHSGYDLGAGKLAWVQVSDIHTAESLELMPLRPGDIAVGDKAYSKALQLMAVHRMAAFSVAFFSAWHLPLYQATAPKEKPRFRFDVRAWLNSLREGTYQQQTIVFADGESLPVRLVAHVPSPEQAQALREKARQRAREKGRTLSEHSLFYAGFHLVVTTLPQASWSAERVLELYRWRWQIEILFKRFKQVLDTHRISCHCWQTAQALILALLIAWLLIEEETEQLRQQIIAGEPEGLSLSCWQLNQLAWHGLRNVVGSWWSPARLRELAPDLKRLLTEKRRRPRLESERRFRAASLLSDASDLLSFFDCSSA